MGLLHLPLSGLLVPPRGCGLEGVGHFVHKLVKRKQAEHLLKMQIQWVQWSCSLLGCAEAFLHKSSGVKLSTPRKPPRPWGGTRDRPFGVCKPWVQPSQTLISVTSCRTTSWKRRWNSPRRWTSWLTSTGWLAPGWAGRVSLGKAHPQASLGDFGAQKPSRGPFASPWYLASAWVTPTTVRQAVFDYPGTLCHRGAKWKQRSFLQEKKWPAFKKEHEIYDLMSRCLGQLKCPGQNLRKVKFTNKSDTVTKKAVCSTKI